MKPSFWRVVSTLTWKDIIIEFRSREMLSSMFVFALLVMIIFNFALELQPGIAKELTAGILWVIFTFSGTLGLNRSMALEKDNGCLDGLLLAPVDRSAIFLGKVFSSLVLMLIVELVVIPLYSFLYSVDLWNPGFFLVVLLGSLGYIAVGIVLSSMVLQARSRELLLPILLFPLTIPVLISAVKAGTGFLQHLEWSEISVWINLLVVYDLVFLVASFLGFDQVIEE